MATDDIVGYTYDTEILCPNCTIESMVTDRSHFPQDPEKILDWIAAEVMVPPVNRKDENTFDSNTFPKIIFEVNASGERCEHCGEDLIQ